MRGKLTYLIYFAAVLGITGAAQGGMQNWEKAVSAANPIHWYKCNETAGAGCIDYGSEGLNGTYDGVLLGQDGFFAAGTAVRFDRTAANIINLGGSDLLGAWTAEYIVKKMSEAGARDSQALHDGDKYGIRLAGWNLQFNYCFNLLRHLFSSN